MECERFQAFVECMRLSVKWCVEKSANLYGEFIHLSGEFYGAVQSSMKLWKQNWSKTKLSASNTDESICIDTLDVAE